MKIFGGKIHVLVYRKKTDLHLQKNDLWKIERKYKKVLTPIWKCDKLMEL